MSGGQRQRISLARSVYHLLKEDSQICVLDEPLSALDARVKQKLIDDVLGKKGLLNQTVYIH